MMRAGMSDFRRSTVPGDLFEEFYKGTEGREASTTMVFVRMLSKLLRDPEIGKLIVPIIPDEARTFGMESLFKEVKIYNPHGQRYEPVDVASEPRHLFDERGRKERPLRRCRYEEGLDARKSVVHLRHLDLVLIVRDRAQPLHDHGQFQQQ